jgi:hypothetical protein
MIGVELDAQRSHPAEFARGIFAALDGSRDAKAIAAVRNLVEIATMHANKLTDGKWSR